MPVTDRHGQAVGVLNLDDSLAEAAGQIVRHIEILSQDSTFEGLCETKHAQKDVALELLDDTVPTPEIQWLLTSINMVLHNRVVAMCVGDMADEGFGEPPVDFDVIVMGSGGRGESYLNPDQDNGIIIADHAKEDHERIDTWFQELAGRKTERLKVIGFELCVGQVMSTNPRWRKSLAGFWLSEIFFSLVFGFQRHDQRDNTKDAHYKEPEYSTTGSGIVKECSSTFPCINRT